MTNEGAGRKKSMPGRSERQGDARPNAVGHRPAGPVHCAFRGPFEARERERLQQAVRTCDQWAFLRFRVPYHGCRLWGVRLADGVMVCAPTVDGLVARVAKRPLRPHVRGQAGTAYRNGERLEAAGA